MRPLDADLWDWVDRQPTHPSRLATRARQPLLPAPYGQWVVEGVCGWELVAIATGLVPTITAVCHARQRRVAVVAGVVVALLVVAHHLLIESPICPTKEKPC